MVSLVFIMLAGVSAQTLDSSVNTPADNFLGRIISSIQQFLSIGQFTAYGVEMKCSTTPNNKVNLSNSEAQWNKYFFFDEQNTCGGNSFFVNFYRGQPGNDQYLGEYYYYQGTVYQTEGDNKGTIYTSQYKASLTSPSKVGLNCDAGSYWKGSKCYAEIYCCSQGACKSNGECSGNEECTKTPSIDISQLFPDLGICQSKAIENPTYQVSIYQCNSDGTSNYIKNISYSNKGSYSFCPQSQNNYLTIGGTASGVCYSPLNPPCTSNKAVFITTQDGITVSQLNSFTTKDLLKSICTTSDQCKNGTCLTLKSLKDNGDITITKENNIISQTATYLVLPATGAVTATAICTGLVASGAVVTAGATAWLLPLCGVVGASVGFAGDKVVTDISTAVQNKQDSSFGYCIVESQGNSFTDFLKTMAFFPITKDKTTDGAIILFGGIALLFLFMFGGRK